jgi:hypothetical protein
LIKSIHAFRFLKIRFIDGCKEMEVACFNSKDSSLIEAGKYKNISQIVSTKALKRNISTDKQKTVTLQINHLQRVGEWKFYDTFGKNIRKEQYPIQ